MPWDIFLSHAREDAGDLAEQLRSALVAMGISVWLDVDQMRVGDPLLASIDNGLAKARFAVVILSPAYFRRAWPHNELEAIVQREASGEKVLLPILHDMTQQQLQLRTPILSARVFLSSTRGVASLAAHIAKIVADNRSIGEPVDATQQGLSTRLDSDDVRLAFVSLPDELQRLLDILTHSSPMGDEFFGLLADFEDKVMHLVTVITSSDAIDLGEYEPILLSIKYISRDFQTFLRDDCPPHIRPFLHGFMNHVSASVVVPIDTALARASADREALDAQDLERLLLTRQTQSDDRDGDDVAEILKALQGDDELARYEGTLRAIGNSISCNALLARLKHLSSADLETVVAGLWSHVDTILMEGEGQTRGVFEAVLSLAINPQQRSRWDLVKRAFSRAVLDAGEHAYLLAGIEAEPDDARRVIGRCLIVHPDRNVRQMALEWLQPDDVWYALANERLPPWWLREMWNNIQARVPEDILKIFFIATRERLGRCRYAHHVAPTVELVKDFFGVRGFHEDSVFGRLVQLGEDVKRDAIRYGLLLDLDAEFIKVFEAFRSTGRAPDSIMSSWHTVPLAVQRLLARRGHFLGHFVDNPQDLIALECLPHVRSRGNISEVIKHGNLNRRLLVELAKDRTMFMQEDDRLHLVMHPRATPPIVQSYMGTLVNIMSLRKVAQSRDCTPFARETAVRKLERLGHRIRS